MAKIAKSGKSPFDLAFNVASTDLKTLRQAIVIKNNHGVSSGSTKASTQVKKDKSTTKKY